MSANLGSYDPIVPWVEQVIDGATVETHRFTDETFTPRSLAMTSRLQCGIPKMAGYELVPGADIYIWVDASRSLLRPDTAAWFVHQLGSGEMLLFRHPERKTIREEYGFMKGRMDRPGETYLNARYKGEWLDAQVAAVTPLWYVDDTLYASTAFAYRPTLRVKEMMRAWWYHKSRYLLHDQLALPYLVREHRINVRVLDDNVYACEHLPMTRPSKRKRAS